MDKVTAADRSRAKSGQLRRDYGMSGFGLSENLHITRRRRSLYSNVLSKHESKRIWISRSKTADGLAFGDDPGTSIAIHEINHLHTWFDSWGKACHEQSDSGSAADIIKIAMIKVHRELKEKHPIPIWSCKCMMNWSSTAVGMNWKKLKTCLCEHGGCNEAFGKTFSGSKHRKKIGMTWNKKCNSIFVTESYGINLVVARRESQNTESRVNEPYGETYETDRFDRRNRYRKIDGFRVFIKTRMAHCGCRSISRSMTEKGERHCTMTFENISEQRFFFGLMGPWPEKVSSLVFNDAGKRQNWNAL